MHIPEWIMPSWAFKRKASSWRPHVIEFKEKPYAMVRERMVSGLIQGGAECEGETCSITYMFIRPQEQQKPV
jgi:hypothetical protein